MAKGGRAIRAGRAFVELFADDSSLVRGLKRAQARLKAFGNAVRNLGLKIAGIGAAAVTALFGASKAFASMGDAMAKMSARTGVGVEALSTLSFAAEQSGSNIGDLENGLRRMAATVYDAGRGSSTATEALGDLGLTLAHLDGLSPDEQFKRIADRLAGVEDPTRRAALAMRIFGGSGTQLLPMMRAGAAGIEQLQDEARRLGLQMSGPDAAAAERFTDAMNRMWRTIQMGVFRIGAAVAPMFEQFAAAVTRASVAIGGWIDANRPLIATVGKVAVGVLAVGAALAGVGVVIAAAAPVLGLLAKAFALVLSPVGLVMAAVATFGAVLAHSGDAGGKVIQWLGSAFEWFKGAVVTAISAVVFAVKNWRQVLEYALVAGVYGIVRFANQVKYFFTDVIPATLKWFWENWRDIFTTVWNFLKTVVVNIGRNLKALWTAISNFVRGKGWEFEWTGLLEGFENTIKKLPEIAEREIKGLEKELGDRVSELGSKLAEDFAAHDVEFKAKLAASPLARLFKFLKAEVDVDVKVPDMPALADLLNDLDGVGEQLDRIGVRGTFGAMRLEGMAAGVAPAERTAKATEQTAKDVKRLTQMAVAGGGMALVFQ